MTSPNKIKIIVTVPHAMCERSPQHHTCDFSAANAASKFVTALRRAVVNFNPVQSVSYIHDTVSKRRGVERYMPYRITPKGGFTSTSIFALDVEIVGPLFGDINRRKLDLNRAEARNSAFRTNLRENIAQGLRAGRRVVVLDMHSYDSKAPWCQQSLRDGLGEPDVVFMSDKPARSVSACEFDDVEALRDELYQRAMPIFRAMVDRNPILDIIKESKQQGAEMALLIEFNEALNHNSNKFTHLVSSLADSLLQRMISRRFCPI